MIVYFNRKEGREQESKVRDQKGVIARNKVTKQSRKASLTRSREKEQTLFPSERAFVLLRVK
jgi:hypothetical protein